MVVGEKLCTFAIAMTDNITYYIAILALIIIGVIAAKKIASCLIKSVMIVVLLAIAAFIYYQYLR